MIYFLSRTLYFVTWDLVGNIMSLYSLKNLKNGTWDLEPETWDLEPETWDRCLSGCISCESGTIFNPHYGCA